MPRVGDAGLKAPYLSLLSRCAAESPVSENRTSIFHAIPAIQPSDAFRSHLGLVRRACPGQGDADPQTAPPARSPRQSEAPCQGSVRASADASRGSGALDRLLLARLSRRS